MRFPGKRIAVMLMAVIPVVGFSSFSPAAVGRMSGNISFVNPVSVTTAHKNISFGIVHVVPGDHVIMDTSGHIRVAGQGSVEDPGGGEAAKIVIGNVNDQTVGFFSDHYQMGQGIGAIKALCSMDGIGKHDQKCDSLENSPNIDKKTLYIGVDMTIASALTPDQTSLSSLDMSVVYMIKPYVCLLLGCAFCLFAGSSAYAACSATPATAQVTQLKWPGLQIPGGSTTYTVSGTGGADSGTGTSLYGASARGQYTISKASGSEACTGITINITSVNCQATGCTLGSWTGNYNGTNLVGNPPWSGLALPAAGKTLYLGATATYDNTVTAGTKTPTFTIAVHYNSNADTNTAETGSIGFDTALSIDTVTNINFGTVQAVTAGDYTINTSGAVTAANGGVWIYGT
ncbi:MAG: hypothetical protein HY052_07705, partial [Proteobacteria bacterium]|nr:hypothetical protein [Pseudomonadota bacterium]